MFSFNMPWYWLSILLSFIGFFKEFRPSEPFIFDFLIGPWRNITEEQVIQDVYPIATYSYLAQLVIVFLITDLCRYKPLIIVLGISGIAVFGMLLWTTSLIALQIIEVIYGTLMATEIAYYTYIYAKVPKEKYPQVTGHVRAGTLVGRFLSGVVGQFLVSYKAMDFRELTYISFGALILSTILAISLPSVPQSIYFYHEGTDKKRCKERCRYATSLMWTHFTSSYSNPEVVKWSIWWSTSMCGFVLVQSYIQPLWNVVNPDMGSGLYNGAVEAIVTLLGALAAIAASFTIVDWTRFGDIALAVCSIIEGLILILASQIRSIYICYACYIMFGTIYHFMITIAATEVAKNILDDTYGLVFGLNTLLSSLMQTAIIAVFINGMGYKPRDQYIVYGTFYFIVAFVFILLYLIRCLGIKCNK